MDMTSSGSPPMSVRTNKRGFLAASGPAAADTHAELASARQTTVSENIFMVVPQ